MPSNGSVSCLWPLIIDTAQGNVLAEMEAEVQEDRDTASTSLGSTGTAA